MSTADDRVFLDLSQERLLKWLSVGLISLIAFESLAVATAMPTVVAALDGKNLYALAMGVAMATQLMTTALAGPWSDSKGPQSCLYTGLVLFIAGLVMCTSAQTMEFFVVGRAVQGLGGGLCVVPLYTLIGNNVRPTHQPAFFAAFAAAWVLPALIGPAIAGFLVKHTTWRVVFGIVPVLLVLAFPLLISTTRKIPHVVHAVVDSHVRRRVLLACGAGISVAVLQVMSGIEPDAFTPMVFVLIAAAVVLTFAFVKPLLPRGTFISRRGLASTVLLRGMTNGTFLGVETFLPLLLQVIHGWDESRAGLVLTVGSVTWALGSAISGRVSNPEIRRRIPFAGALIQMVGIAVTLVGAFDGISGIVVVIGWTITGLGIGLVYPTMTVHALAMTRPENQGTTSSSLQLADTLGAAFCVAVAGIAYALILPAQSLAFVGAIGLMAVFMAGAIVISRRVFPHPGSREEVQLRETHNIG